VSSAILSKVAKHLVVLACLTILGQAAGRSVIGPAGIFLLIIAAALLDSASRILHRRFNGRMSFSRGES
jgi:hypothetical protein